jgi:ATP-binding cassette subfamily C protein
LASDPVRGRGEAALAGLRREAVRGALLLVALSLACNVGVLAVPLYNMQVFNRVMTTHNLHTLVGLSVGAAIAVIAYVAVDHLRHAAMAALGDRFARRIAPPLLHAAGLAWPRGADANQVLRDAETLRGFVASPSLTAPFDLVWTPVLLVVLLLMGWGYAVIGAICVTVLVVLNLAGDAMSRRHMQEASAAAAAGYRDVACAARSAEAVVAMGMLPALSRRWRAAEAGAAAAGTRALLRSRGITAATRALRSAMTGATVATGLVLVLNGYASSGTLVAANMILAKMLQPVEQFAGTLRQWAEAAAAWKRVRALLTETAPLRYAHALPRPEGRLAVERLVYLPPGAERPVLRGVSFGMAPGEVVGVIGPSASGKSTLLRLALGMAEPTSGGVFLDGHSTYLWNREDLARHVGFVPQALAVSEGTVAECIARGAEPDLDLVLAAAKRAGVHAAVAALPHGYATPITGGGFTLSSGQRQRLALARALYGAPRLLVLDEPSAFLDADGEAMLVALLGRLRGEGVGALVSAHRPKVVRAADKLLVLRDGLVEHFGETEAVLRAMNGPRVRLVRGGAPGIAATAS